MRSMSVSNYHKLKSKLAKIVNSLTGTLSSSFLKTPDMNILFSVLTDGRNSKLYINTPEMNPTLFIYTII